MTIYYCDSAGSNTAPYDTWAKAATTLTTALGAATAAGDIIYIASTHTENLSADTTYTINAASTHANPIRLICVDKTSGGPPTSLQTMEVGGGYIGHSSTGYSITINGSGVFYGLDIRVPSGGKSIFIGNGDNNVQIWESCRFRLETTYTGSVVRFGTPVQSYDSLIITKNCKFKWGSTSQKIRIMQRLYSYGDDFSIGTVHPTTLIEAYSVPASVRIEGGDLTDIDQLLVSSPTGPFSVEFYGCSLKSGFSVFGALSGGANGEAALFDCAVGDSHLQFMHANYWGNTTLDTTIYAADGRSWKIVTTAHANYLMPYIGPWIHAYHTGTSAITPSLEVLRDGSATAYNDDELWAEFQYKATSGSTRTSFVDDRKGLLASAAAQATGALGAGDWTGESATAWYGKLAPASAITPAETGYISARPVVGAASATVYVDPQIRTLT